MVYGVGAGDDPDAAFQALESLLFESCEEWADRRTSIIRGAESDSANPSRRSEYCLKALRALVSDTSKEATRSENFPELAVVERQVSDHLRKLNGDGIVHSCRMRTKQGKDICNLWGLSEWGTGCRERKPERHLETVREDMPFILGASGGKGLFDYGTVLPSYIPKMLTLHSAALSTSQIKSVVVAKLSPPIMSVADNPALWEGDEGEDLVCYPTFGRMPSPEDMMAEAEMKRAFYARLTEREVKVLELKEEGHSIEEIALRLGCSKKTVNNDWKSIFEKCTDALAA